MISAVNFFLSKGKKRRKTVQYLEGWGRMLVLFICGCGSSPHEAKINVKKKGEGGRAAKRCLLWCAVWQCWKRGARCAAVRLAACREAAAPRGGAVCAGSPQPCAAHGAAPSLACSRLLPAVSFPAFLLLSLNLIRKNFFFPSLYAPELPEHLKGV